MRYLKKFLTGLSRKQNTEKKKHKLCFRQSDREREIMTLRGIISPPRSRSSPRERLPYKINNAKAAVTNNPSSSKPNYMSPRRGPINPNDLQRSLRKETGQQSTAVKPATAIRPTPRINNDRSSSNNTNSRIDPSKSTSKIVPSRRQTVPPNPKEKKLENNDNGSKTATKISTKPSSPRTTTKLISQTPRGSTPNSSKSNGKLGAVGSGGGSRSDFSGAKASGVAKDNGATASSNNGDVGNQNAYSGGLYATLSDPEVRNHLQQLSIDGKDLASIILHENSIYESVRSDTKEDQCSIQSNAPRIFQIYKEIAFYRQGNSSITSYVTKLEEFWDELATYNEKLPQCSCGAIEKLSEQTEKEKVIQFLMGLNDSYSTICAQILLMRPFPTVEKAYTVISREEKRRELVLSLEMVAAKVMQNNWLIQNGDNNDGIEEVGNNISSLEQQVDQNEVTSFPIEPLLIDLGSPVRC